MDQDRLEGAARQIVGNVKEGAGELTGDGKLQLDGKTESVVGKLQNAVGGIRDTIYSAVENSGVNKEDFTAIGDDLAALISGPIRKRPLMFVGGAFVLGWLMAKRRSY